MKTKRFIKVIGMAFTMAMLFNACSQDSTALDEVVATEEQIADDEPLVYTMHLNCEAPGYMENGTRATTTWANGSTIYLRFGSVAGTATYSSSTGLWTVTTTSTLATTTTETNCNAYYFENPGTVSSDAVTLTEKTAIYEGTGRYTHPTSTDIYVNATLDPKTWRMRFNGGSVTLLGSESEMNYNSSFNRSTGSFTTSKMGDVNLQSTEYVYGMFVNANGDNIIKVQTDNTYSRTFNGANLKAKESGYFTAPNSTNYSEKNWNLFNIDPNATIIHKNFCAFTDAMVTAWELGSNVATFDYHVYTKEFADICDDDELADLIMNSNPYSIEYANYAFSSTGLSSNTEYCLCAAAKNSEGVRGPVLRYVFNTLSEDLPYAEISNVQAESTTKWTYDIALKNNAKAYYLATSTDEDDFTGNWHWWAYYTYRWATTGQLTARTWESVATTLSSGSCNVITICTWGIDTNNNIGNCNIAYGSVSSSRRSNDNYGNQPLNECISIAELQKRYNSTQLYLIEGQ